MKDFEIITLTPDTIADYGVCGYKDSSKHRELQRKIEWYSSYFPKGLRIKALIAESGGYQGMIEYIPGEYAHRPVNAKEYMFIHCLFVGFKKEFKGRGYATALLEECINEAKEIKMKGVAVVTRKGSFMANKEIFLKLGFIQVDNSKPDFELLVKKFDHNAQSPSFRGPSLTPYADGLYILRSAQCPYSVKNVEAIIESAKEMGLNAELVELDTHTKAQNSPSPFGTFCIILNGKIQSYHPISNKRFQNIMKKL